MQDSEDGSMSADGNEITIELLPSSFAQGVVECELQLYSSTEDDPQSLSDCDVLVTTAKFNFRCRAAMLGDEAYHAFPQLPMLTQALSDIDEAEAARQAAETARAAAEAGRVTAEAARAAAETQREQTLENFIAYAGIGAKAVNSAPGSGDGDAVGRIYVVRNGGAAYICNAMTISAGDPSFQWRKLAFESPWESVKTLTLGADSSEILLNADSNGDPFEWDELRIVIVGIMRNSTQASIYVNGSQSCVRDLNFMVRDSSTPANNISIVTLHKMEESFAMYEREFGGTDASTGLANVKTAQKAALKMDANAAYTSVRIVPVLETAKFASGTVIKLMGRNLY